MRGKIALQENWKCVVCWLANVNMCIIYIIQSSIHSFIEHHLSCTDPIPARPFHIPHFLSLLIQLSRIKLEAFAQHFIIYIMYYILCVCVLVCWNCNWMVVASTFYSVPTKHTLLFHSMLDTWTRGHIQYNNVYTYTQL